MYLQAQMRLVAQYSLGQNAIVRNKIPNLRGMMEVYFNVSTNTSQKRIKAPFVCRNMPQATPEPDFEPLSDLVDSIDDMLFGRDRIDAVNSQNDDVPSLQKLCMDRLLYRNFLFGTNNGLKYWVDTSTEFTPSKLVKLYEEFCIDRNPRDFGYQTSRRLAAQAVELLYDMLGTRKYFGTQKFQFNPYLVMRSMSLNASSGIRPGPTVSAEGIKAGVVGKKFEQIGFAMSQLESWVHDTIVHQKKIQFPNYNVMKIKAERRFKYAANHIDLIGLPDKAREFFINGLEQQLLSETIGGMRMKLERGNVINIGRRWWYGGAYEFAIFLNYDMPNMTWHEGDFIGYDKHVVDWLLMIYMSANQIYYDIKSMTQEEKYLFMRMHEEVIFNMVCKLTCHITGAWRIISGIMWSGGKETSHGDSWITLFVFCLFLVYQMTTHPHYELLIRKCLRLGFVRLATYGDDHLFCAPRQLSGVINELEFQRVAKLLVGMEIQDPLSYDHFLTEFNPATGEITKVGPKFLKRYFVASTDPSLAPVLPFKPTHQTVCRLLLSFKTYWHTILLSSIGQAWDTMGTNRTAYRVCKLVYQEAIKKDSRTPLEIYQEYSQQTVNLNELRGLLRKAGLSAREMFCGFPSRRSILLRHIYNQKKADFSWTPEAYHGQIEMVEEEYF